MVIDVIDVLIDPTLNGNMESVDAEQDIHYMELNVLETKLEMTHLIPVM